MGQCGAPVEHHELQYMAPTLLSQCLVKHEKSVVLVGARGEVEEVTNWDVTQSMVPPSHPATNALDQGGGV